jgi:putative ABC transport system permease protein
MRTFFRRLVYLLNARQHERDLRNEMESHRAMVQERLERAGMSASDAARESRRALGNVTLAREEARELWLWPSLERLWQDVRYGGRLLLKQRTFAVTAVGTLAIGIAATTAMMSVVGGELWRPLPFVDPDRLVSIHSQPAGSKSWDHVSNAELHRWQRDAASLSAVAATGPAPRRVLRSGRVPESVRTRQVTANFFTTLGWSAAIGRIFVAADDNGTTDGRVILLTDTAWRRFFNGNPLVIGQRVVLDDQAMEIVGVLGPDQRLEMTSEPDLYTVIGTRGADAAARNLDPIARLNPGASAAAAQDELLAIEARANAGPALKTVRGVRVDPLAEAVTGYNWRTLYFFLGASAFVLLLSCANVANLLLARALDRDREFAIRAALGGGRAALVRQLLVEGVWIAVPGTLAGVLLASWTLHGLSSWVPPGYLVRGMRTDLDIRAAAFAFLACGLTTTVFGLVPLLFNRVQLSATLARTSRSVAGSPAQHRARRALVVAEIVIAFVLVFAAGLFLNSFVRLRNAPLGFDPADRLTLAIALPGQRYASPESRAIFADRAIEEIRAIPGVAAAAVGSTLPLGSGLSMTFVRADQPPPPAGEEAKGPARTVGVDYFRALDIPIVSGRAFTAADGAGAAHVAIINQTLAGVLFPDGDAVGREIVARPRASGWLPEERVAIVGVARNSKDVGVHEVEMSSIYLPLAQHPPTAMQLVVHTSVPATSSSLVDQVRRAVSKVDSSLPVLNVSTMDERVDDSTRSNRFHLALLGTFAAVAIALAAIGLYGSIAYATQRRIPELALRAALGARTRSLLLLVVRQAMTLGCAGVAIGIVAALLLARAIGDGLYLVRGQHEGLIYGVATTDASTLAAAALVVAAITVAAGALPARRAASIDPATVLRNE